MVCLTLLTLFAQARHVSAQAAGDLCVLDAGMIQAHNTFMRRATLSQTFTPTQSGTLTRITHGLQNISTVNNYDLLITTTAAGLPTWTGGSYNTANVLLKLTGQTIFANSGTVNGVINLPTAQQIALTAGTKYALILIPGTPASGQMAWRGNSSAGSYANGAGYQLSGTTWTLTTVGPKDHGFKLEGPCGGDTPSNGHWCCPGTNLVRNGDFSAGNSFFTSQYSYNSVIGANTVFPGQYGIVNGNQALSVSSTWLAADHATCNATAGNFMAINGITGQTGNRTIWRQTVAVTPGKQYRFCANVRNMKACAFDVRPVVLPQFNVPTSFTATTVNAGPNACDWQLISGIVNVPAGTTSLNINLLLNEQAIGDGNDLALDDISLQEIPQANVNYVLVDIATHNTGAGQYSVSASYPTALPLNFGYYWEVTELNTTTNAPIASVSNPAAWWTFPNSTSPNTFNGYTGSGSTLTGSAPGVFLVGHRYRITFGVWSDCEGWRQSSWLLEFNTRSSMVQITPVKLRDNELRKELPQWPRPVAATRENLGNKEMVQEKPSRATKENESDSEKPKEKSGNKISDILKSQVKRNNLVKPPASPGAKEASALPRAEDDRSAIIAVAKPTVEVGQVAPDFAVKDLHGNSWKLSDLRGKKNVLLTFFPKCFTGGCANHLSSLRDQQEAFDASDTQVLAVSVDPAEGERGQIAFSDQWRLTFPLIPDTGRSLSMLYGAASNNKELAARMSVFIDKAGIVRIVDTNVKVVSHGADIMARIREFTG